MEYPGRSLLHMAPVLLPANRFLTSTSYGSASLTAPASLLCTLSGEYDLQDTSFHPCRAIQSCVPAPYSLRHGSTDNHNTPYNPLRYVDPPYPSFLFRCNPHKDRSPFYCGPLESDNRFSTIHKKRTDNNTPSPHYK